MGPWRDRVVSQYEMRQKEKEKDYRRETIECVDMLTFESRVPGGGTRLGYKVAHGHSVTASEVVGYDGKHLGSMKKAK
jgi:hypothetical protein